MSYTVDCNKVFEDENGIFFLKTNFKHENLGKVRPQEMGFTKTQTARIYIYKEIQSTENLDNETVFFDMTLTFAFPEDRKEFKTQYFYKCRSGRVMLRDFSSGVCSEVSINSELVTRGRAKKLDPNTRIPKNAPIFRINSSGELERQISENSIW